jgi:outer membrane protein OmpA-like peptidoglycan-associated protein
MSRYLLVIFFFLTLTAFPQKKSFKVGEHVNISADVYNEENAAVAIVIPENKYTIFYNYDWKGSAKDIQDSITKIETILTKIISLYKMSQLRVVVCSYDKGSNYRIWQEMMKKQKPFKAKNRCSFEYYNTNDYTDVAKSLQKLFGKIAFIQSDGKMLALSATIEDFGKQVTELPGMSDTKLKAKLLTDSAGVRVPLIKTLVCMVNPQRADTFAKTRTDEHGDFEMFLPENVNYNYELSVKQNGERPVTVVLAAQNGIEIAEFEKSNGEFRYRVLPADITRLQEIQSNDINLAFRNFKTGTDYKLKVIEYIVYPSGKFTIEKPAETILNKVVEIMKQNPNVKLEIVSHTDAQGDDAKNMALSEKRSDAVLNYLVKKGIDTGRLKAYGKGESMIRNRCSNNVECSDKEHEYNRRTEFNFTKG